MRIIRYCTWRRRLMEGPWRDCSPCSRSSSWRPVCFSNKFYPFWLGFLGILPWDEKLLNVNVKNSLITGLSWFFWSNNISWWIQIRGAFRLRNFQFPFSKTCQAANLEGQTRPKPSSSTQISTPSTPGPFLSLKPILIFRPSPQMLS